MSNIELIKQLREITSAPMATCKDSLIEAKWNIDVAIDIVKVKGLQQTAKNAGKVAGEGAIIIIQDKSYKSAIMVDVSCQTDFAAKSSEFIDFANKTSLAISNSPDNFSGDFNQISFDGFSVEKHRENLIASIKENVIIRRWIKFSVQQDNETVSKYLHINNKIGVLVSFFAQKYDYLTTKDFNEFADNIAMQIASMNPAAMSRKDISIDEIEKQENIFKQQLAETDKPPVAWPKIIEGKFNKWFAEMCLLEQEFVINPKTSINQLVKNISTKFGGKINIIDFVRYQVGEGIIQQTNNFANDVAEMIK